MVKKCAGILLASLALVACSREESFDYCKDHYQVHVEHQDSIARLDGALSPEGQLTMRLKLPASVFGTGPAAAESSSVLGVLLQNPEQVYQLDTDQPCSVAKVQVTQVGSGADSGVELEYRAECGAGNQIRQVNVGLFDLIEGLEEVEVQMDTTATRKHFAISRLCERAIFRLKAH